MQKAGWVLARMKLLWRVFLLQGEARRLELEIQALQQKAYDLKYAGRKEEALYQEGMVAGIYWCLNRKE